MTNIVALQLADGPPVLIEASVERVAASDGVIETGFGERARDGAASAGAALEASVKGAAQALAQAAFDIAPAPVEVEVTFGVKVAGEAGNIVIGRGTAEANFTIRCLWRRVP